MKSARHMYLIADKGVMGALADGTHRFGPEGISADRSFGDEITDAQATITVDGTLETGVYNNQFIGFGRDFGTFVADSSTPIATDTTRQTLYYNALTENWERRSVDNTTLIENIALTTTSSVPTDINADYRSDDSVRISFDVGRSLAQDIDDEIAALDAALLTSFDNASAGYLLTRHQTISNRITALSPGGGVDLSHTDASYSDIRIGLVTAKDNLTAWIADFDGVNLSQVVTQPQIARIGWMRERVIKIESGTRVSWPN